jgi:hypothetical protein
MITGAQQITDPYVVEILKIAHRYNVEVRIDSDRCTVDFITEDDGKIDAIAVDLALLGIG